MDETVAAGRRHPEAQPRSRLPDKEGVGAQVRGVQAPIELPRAALRLQAPAQPAETLIEPPGRYLLSTTPTPTTNEHTDPDLFQRFFPQPVAVKSLHLSTSQPRAALRALLFPPPP